MRTALHFIWRTHLVDCVVDTDPAERSLLLHLSPGDRAGGGRGSGGERRGGGEGGREGGREGEGRREKHCFGSSLHSLMNAKLRFRLHDY